MADPIKPVTPDEVFDNKEKYCHPDIIEIVNKLLNERHTRGELTKIEQGEIVILFQEKNPGSKEKVMLAKGWLDFEDVYRKAGWIVNYEKPIGYGGDSYFEPYYAFGDKE